MEGRGKPLPSCTDASWVDGQIVAGDDSCEVGVRLHAADRSPRRRPLHLSADLHALRGQVRGAAELDADADSLAAVRGKSDVCWLEHDLVRLGTPTDEEVELQRFPADVGEREVRVVSRSQLEQLVGAFAFVERDDLLIALDERPDKLYFLSVIVPALL